MQHYGTTPAGDDDLLTVGEVAAMCRVSPLTVRGWIRGGKLPACRLGSAPNAPLRIARADLARFVNPVSIAPDIRRAVPPWTLH